MYAGDMPPSPDSEEDQKLHSSSCAAWDAYVSLAFSVVFRLRIITRVLESHAAAKPHVCTFLLPAMLHSRYAGWSGVDLALLFRRLDKDALAVVEVPPVLRMEGPQRRARD